MRKYLNIFYKGIKSEKLVAEMLYLFSRLVKISIRICSLGKKI